MNDQQKMQASDRDRQQVVDRLRSALEDGRLTMDEYVDRMEVWVAGPYGAALFAASAGVTLFRRTRGPGPEGPVRTACAGASG